MLVISNKYIPSAGKGLKKQKPIADTAAGDNAYYITKTLSPKRKKSKLFKFEDSDDDDIEDDEFDLQVLEEADEFDHDKPQRSFTGSEWRPCFNDRLTMFIAGTPGAGKSYLAKQMINLLPSDLPILLFTALEEKDGNFDDLGSERLYKIKMNPETLSKIKLSEIRERSGKSQTILLFDDVDKIRDPKVQNATFAIMNDALANGRGHEKHDGKGDVHVICTSHSANDYQKTKYTFENSNYVALFPGTTPPLQMYRMFDKLGLEKELCQQMIKLARQQKIRSIIIHKVVPMYMIFGNKIMLL